MPLSFYYFVFSFLFSEVQFVFVLISFTLRLFGDLWPVCVCNGGLGATTTVGCRRPNLFSLVISEIWAL